LAEQAKYIRNPADERAIAEGCYFDEEAAQRVRRFFSSFLRHSKGRWAGQPFELLEWQRDDIIYPLFGWKRKDGSRRFRKAYIEIPKKNGKSTLAAGIGLYMLIGDSEGGAEVYSVACDRKQAGIVHGEAINMVEASPALSSHININRTTHRLTFAKTRSWYDALSSEADTKEGLNAHALIVDELHAWKGRALWDALRFAGRARHQPLLFVITTAGDDMHSVCREQHDYAKGVLSGDIEDTRFFGYIRAARQISEGDEKDDDWTKPATWRRANPSMGITIDEGEFAADIKEAQKSATTQASTKRYGLNIWSTSTNPWLKSDDWKSCERSFAEADLVGKKCWGGLDLAKTRDMTALVLCFPWEDETYRILPYFWLPEDLVNDPDSPEQYRVWAQNGHVETTPGSVCDYAFVKRRVGEMAGRFQFQDYAYDPYNAEQVTQEIEDEHGVERILFAQTVVNFAEPTAEFERLVISGKMHHNGHPVMTWQAGHVQVRTDANNNKRPVKAKEKDQKKIDGIVAGIMALARAMQGEETSTSEIIVL